MISYGKQNFQILENLILYMAGMAQEKPPYQTYFVFFRKRPRLQKAKFVSNDNKIDLKNSMVVIDDPVSSLDANSIYSAFGFMKKNKGSQSIIYFDS
jgi:hypothetical protein